jgi:hypothetical protein
MSDWSPTNYGNRLDCCSLARKQGAWLLVKDTMRSSRSASIASAILVLEMIKGVTAVMAQQPSDGDLPP